MTTLVNNPQEAFNLLKEDPKNTFRGIWTITDEGYISIVNNVDSPGTMYSRCIFPVLLNDFSVEWTTKYIPGINPNTGGAQETPVYCIDHYVSQHSTFWMNDDIDSPTYCAYILYCFLSNYSGRGCGSIMSSSYYDYATSSANISLSREGDNSFKFVRENGKYTLYKDGEQVSQINDPEPNKGVYLSWCLGYTHNPSVIVKEYKLISLDGIEDSPESKRYLDKIGLSYFWDKIKSLFKTHIDNDNIHITPDEKDKLNSIDLSIYAKKSEIPDISNLQEKLVAGDNITIEENVISATGSGEGSGSADLSNYYTKAEIDEKINTTPIYVDNISAEDITEICQ